MDESSNGGDCGVRHKTRGDVDGMVLYITALPYIIH